MADGAARYAGRVISAPDDLRRWLADQPFDLRDQDLDGFRRWLGANLDRWQHDAVFVLRTRIRDVRRARPDLRRLEEESPRALRAYAATPLFARHQELRRELANADKAVAGLTDAVSRAHAGTADKLATFRAKRAALADELAALQGACPELQGLLQIMSEIRAIKSAAGIDRLEAELADRQTARGRHSGRSGESFEDAAAAVATGFLCEPGARLFRGVRLGSARTEFDLLAARVADGGAAEVRAVVEAKRNPNDLARGFLHRQDDLAWLTGEHGRYDSAVYRTRAFPTGHFDRPSEHNEGGTTVRFDPSSFRRFRRDPAAGVFLDGLHLVTRVGPLWGVSGVALARIATIVATDVDWNPDDDGYLESLRARCRALAGPLEAPDVVRLYAGNPDRGRLLAVAGS
jgi:hypothetical protein